MRKWAGAATLAEVVLRPCECALRISPMAAPATPPALAIEKHVLYIKSLDKVRGDVTGTLAELRSFAP